MYITRLEDLALVAPVVDGEGSLTFPYFKCKS